MADSIQFSIIIPFLRGPRGLQTLLPCIESCLRQIGKIGRSEIRIITNLQDPSLDKLAFLRAQSGPKVHLECAGKIGVNGARNLGARRSKGEFLLFLDDDCVLPHERFLEEMSLKFSANPAAAALGGHYISPKSSCWRVRGYNAMAKAWLLLSAQAGTEGDRQVMHLLGGNVCYRRELFDLGYWFDESIISGGDEAEFHLRLNRAGHQLVYASSLSVIHQADSSWIALLKRAWRQGRARSTSGVSSAVSRRRMVAPFLEMIREEPVALPFSLVHFPVALASQLKNAPDFSRTVKQLRRRKSEEQLWKQVEASSSEA